MNEVPPSPAPRPHEVIAAWEMLLLKARSVARQIEERVCQAMADQPLSQPHAPGHGVSCTTPAEQGQEPVR
jgi:hypothetical protein